MALLVSLPVVVRLEKTDRADKTDKKEPTTYFFPGKKSSLYTDLYAKKVIPTMPCGCWEIDQEGKKKMCLCNDKTMVGVKCSCYY